MRYEVFPDTDGIDVWRAEAVDHDSEGECYVVIFSGPESERRAREYAAWVNELAWWSRRLAAWEAAIPQHIRDEMRAEVEAKNKVLGLIRRKPSDGGDETLVKKLGWKPLVWQEVSPDG